MDHRETIKSLFEYFYHKLYKVYYKLDLTVHSKLIDNFTKRIGEMYPINAVGNNFLIHYFAHAFNYYSNLTTKRKITLNWIIGKKMIDRWFNRASTTEYFVNRFIKEYNVDVDFLKRLLAGEQEIEELSKSEEIEKIRHTGEARLYHCLTFTTLYNHKSVNCLTCYNRSACKLLLQKVNPNLYKKRGYK